ncbi:hypothetical protein Acr_06g0010990 [Actinidia rufa]|uniref:Uncharacterized protein n=1 Tax=Actinidia rufa TaxID=165716 RepID=A0A7J0ET25_9ERIC|nr:hypothetical protein Acr_06g0010990 [Actinidia rufa]
MMTLDKNCGKFRGKTLEHSDLMEQIFGGMTATGRSHWTPGEALPSTALIDESSGSSDEAPTDEFGVGSGWKERTLTARLSWTMDKMLEVVQSQGSEVTVKPHADSNNW